MPEQVQSPELEELERILASPEFRSTRRGQRMLRYLVEHALSGDLDRLKERIVGFELFGRDPDYDTARDSIVRVAANDIRKRLADYYVREYQSPAAPPLRILLPTGSYVPVFERSEIVAAEPPALLSKLVEPLPAAVSFHPASRRGWALMALVCGVTALLVSGGWWLWAAPGRSASTGGPGPTTDLFWKQVFGNGRPTCMVLSDSNLTMFQEIIGRRISVQEYVQKRFPELVERELGSREEANFAELMMRPPSTSMADAGAARVFGEIDSRHSISTDLIFARDFNTGYFDSHNVVLLGSLRANPWIGLFESQMNFQAGSTEKPVVSYFANRSARQGERPRYDGIWNREGYCRVALLPSLKRAGSVLILSGTGLSTTAAGAEFVTNEAWLNKFRSMLKLADGERFPYFEVLLRVDLVNAVALKFEIAGWRTYQPDHRYEPNGF